MTDSQTGQGENGSSLDRIRQLAALMEQYGLSQLEVAEKGRRVRLRRPHAAPAAGPPRYTAPATRSAANESAADEPHMEGDAGAPAAKNVAVIRSPMVGTFYNKANPDAEPYVSVGDHVGPDTIVCIIEAMKVFNEIPAEVSGRVIAVLLENEEPVDFGRPLFHVDTSG